jgi:acyl-CoA thioesterase
MNGALQTGEDDELDRRFGPGRFGELLGVRLIQADEEGATVEAIPGPEHTNGGGIVHGGYLGALLDIATGWAVESRLQVGVGAPHIQNGVQYVRAALPGEPLICTGRCIRVGRSVVSAEAEIRQGSEVIARVMTSHIVITPP